MEPINSTMKWRHIQGMIGAESGLTMTIGPHRRRTRSWKRKKGEQDERSVVRLIIQRPQSSGVRTLYRKNLRDLGDDYLDQTPTEGVVEQINAALALQ